MANLLLGDCLDRMKEIPDGGIAKERIETAERGSTAKESLAVQAGH